MKQLLLSLLFCVCCFGQQSTAPTIVIFPGSPSGKVCSPSQIGLNSATGATCGCSAGVFASCGGGGGGSGTVTSIATTSPITGGTITTTGTIAAPSLVALGTIPTCVSIATAVLNGTIVQGTCYTQFTNTQINSLQVQGANTVTIGAEPPSGSCTYATQSWLTYDATGSAFTNCQSVPNTASFSIGYADQSGAAVSPYTNTLACLGFMDQTSAQMQVFDVLSSGIIGGIPAIIPISTDIAGQALTLANSGDLQTTGGAGSHVKVYISFLVAPCP